jgi:hypothetical protein
LHVAVVGLIDKPGEEFFAHGQQFLGRRNGVDDQRRIEDFEHIGIRLEREDEELLELPEDFLAGVVFELFGDAKERQWRVAGGR